MKFNKLTKWIVCALLLVLLLSACEASDGVDTDTSVPVADAEITTTSAIDAADTTVPSVDAESIAMADLTKYVLVRPENADEDLVDAVKDLRDALKKSVGIELTIKSDLHFDSVPAFKIGEFEILIGDCDRDESRQFEKQLRKDDYGYAMIGKKLVISGGSEQARIKAVERFIISVAKQQSADDEWFYDGAEQFIQKGKYSIDTLTLQGSDISEYVIVYSENNGIAEALASELSDRIASASGYKLSITSDKSPQTNKEILIGTTNRTDPAPQAPEAGTYIISAKDTTVCVRGADSVGDYCAVHALIDALVQNASATHHVTLSEVDLRTVPADNELKAMSFNILASSATAERKLSVTQTIVNNLPDTIGVQEASTEWMTYLNSKLGGLYANVGNGRDGGAAGEHCAIFYRKDRFELIETGTKWLSDTPDTVSKYSESTLNRILTYAILLEKSSNTKILYVNTHLEHGKAVEARDKQIKIVMEFLKGYTQYPIVLTGDFNSSQTTDVYKLVTATLADSSQIAKTAEIFHTFHKYGVSSSYLDYIFVTKQSIAVSHYRVVVEPANGMLPSDHYPLLIKYSIAG